MAPGWRRSSKRRTSIIPGPLAVQPTLTVVALALRTAAALSTDPA
jgi:hypothetical protein